MSSIPQDNEQTQVSALSKVLLEREKQLLEVKTQLQEAVKEMEETTASMQQLKDNKTENERTINDLSQSVKEFKKQLKSTHERCQDLQNDLTHAEQLVVKKENDVSLYVQSMLYSVFFMLQIQQILTKLKEKGQTELSDVFEEIQQLKGQNRVQEKQIMNLVKASNKLQDSCDLYEKENEALRYTLVASCPVTNL